MPTESGFSSQKMIDRARHKTLHPMGSDRIGEPTAQMYLAEVTTVATTIATVEKATNPKHLLITLDNNHNSRKGDIFRLLDGPLVGWEIEIVSIQGAAALTVQNIGDAQADGATELLPDVGDLVKCLRWVTATASPEGALVTTPGPLQFIEDAVVTVVNKDNTDPSNTKGLPVEDVGMGVSLPLIFDFSATNVDDTAWVELSADIGADGCKKAQIFMSSGEPLWLGIGAAAAEVNYALITPGGNGFIDFKLPPNSRLSIMAVNAVIISEGLLLINLIG